jgi:hypothetical protein
VAITGRELLRRRTAMANWNTNYTDMEELEKIFRNWYMDLLDNKEYIHGLL